MEPRDLSFNDYTIGWICALPVELEAAQLIFKTTHPLPSIPNDRNIYHSAQFGPDNIIIACFPGDETGTDSPTKAVTRFLSTFQRLRFYLMVGIGSGIPSQTMDIRLGDIVVSEPKTESVGVIQFEMHEDSTSDSGRIETTGNPHKSSGFLLWALMSLRAYHSRYPKEDKIGVHRFISNDIPSHLRNRFSRPTQGDELFEVEYHHRTDGTCIDCDQSKIIQRDPRKYEEPDTHYGIIGSTNDIVRNGKLRERLARELGTCCVDSTDLTGLVNHFSGLVIRGIYDYADSHNSQDWKPYAALVAAAYGKQLLSLVLPEKWEKT